MRRIVLAVGMALLLAACSGSARRPLERYYDPQGLFTADLPAANTVQVLQPQSATSGPSLASGVSSMPASASPSASDPTGLGIATSVSSDQTQYRVLVISGGTFQTPEDLSLLQMDDPAADLKIQQPTMIGGSRGLLVVADYQASGTTPAYSVASGFLLDGALAYWISAAFPEGSWGSEQADFMTVLRSFRTNVSPGVAIAPLSNPNA